ncbi:DegT/DnrJ/EryC1/StrS family aminotransferase [Streptomyces erythrochromogenes]|nr:DegT/DnrJ/EryC1/StrS family aminotransferase [Streptomyces erythrochromogenes]WST98350.1 DegT/DnrJ/EryC1/StrS family aminotransferase [Streptomyces erythrochromogenes]
MPTATFMATAFAVAGLGAVPMVVDIAEPTLTLRPKAMEAAVTDRTLPARPARLPSRHGAVARGSAGVVARASRAGRAVF